MIQNLLYAILVNLKTDITTHISVLSVCQLRYKGHQNQLKYLKFPSSFTN